MLMPSLSQHLLMTSVLKDEPIAPLDILVSAASALGLALLLFVLTARHWRRESYARLKGHGPQENAVGRILVYSRIGVFLLNMYKAKRGIDR